jgi:hypothetical protein
MFKNIKKNQYTYLINNQHVKNFNKTRKYISKPFEMIKMDKIFVNFENKP